MKASEGPSPRAMAASTSREVVTWMSSDTLCVWSHFPPGRCSTKPRSVDTGPPRSTAWAPMSSVEGSSFICESTSESFIGRGLLSTIPSAPFSVCSQMSATVWAKFGSISCGIAISRWLVRLPPSGSAPGSPPGLPSTRELSTGVEPLLVGACLRAMPPVWARWARLSRKTSPARRLRKGRHGAALHAPAHELPFVGKPQHPILCSELRGERIEGTGELQDRERRLVELRVAARAADERAVEGTARGNGQLEHGGCGHAGGARHGRVVEGSDPLDLAPPGVQVGRERRGTRIRGDPQLIALGSPQLCLRLFLGGSGLGGRLLVDEQRPVVQGAAAPHVADITHVGVPGRRGQDPLIPAAGHVAER